MENNKVEKIFDNISSGYDKTNSLISLGIEKYWRKKFDGLISGNEKIILDACCGTGTSSFRIWEKTGRNALVYGLDASDEMLRLGKAKFEKIKENNGNASGNIIFRKSDIENTGFPAKYFDLITIVFGIRNISGRENALKELARVAKDGACLICMEFNFPSGRFFRKIYGAYLDLILVNAGAAITGNRTAYLHLAETIKNFSPPGSFIRILESAGWANITALPMTLGTCYIYKAFKIQKQAYHIRQEAKF